MSEKTCEFQISAEFADKCTAVKIPARIFSPLAEQLRWDSIRAGQIGIDDLNGISAAAKACTDDNQEFSRIEITLRRKKESIASKYYDILQWQGLALFAQAAFCDFSEIIQQPHKKVEIYLIVDRTDCEVSVPLSPLRVSVENPSRKIKSASYLRRMNLIVAEDITNSLVELSRESLDRRVEIGGCLVGRMTDLDNIIISKLVHADGAEFSAGHFSFEPRFWLNVNSRLAGTGLKILGFYHSHLCEEGYTSNLSSIDLQIFHLHFVAPWSVSALICSTREKPEVRWFGWENGSIVALETAKVQLNNSIVGEK